VKRTKKALADAFISLLETKHLDDITINELCDVAGVRRATFYKHYNDKFDFISAYTRSLRDEFDRDVWASAGHLDPKEYFTVYAREAVSFINENRVAVDNLINSGLFPTALSTIIEQNLKDTEARLREYVKHGMKLSSSVEVTAAMLAGGVTSAIFYWITSGRRISAEDLSNQIESFLETAL
jgi:AcrR family transcriptional regulator